MKRQMIILLLDVTAIQAENLIQSIEEQNKLAESANTVNAANLHIAVSRSIHKSLYAAQSKIKYLLELLKSEID